MTSIYQTFLPRMSRMKTKQLPTAEPMPEPPCKLISGFVIALLTTSHVAKIPSLERHE